MVNTIKIHARLLTDLGRVRARNQDTPGLCEPKDPQVLARSGSLYIVADGAGGVGGARAGKIASCFAVNKVRDLYYRSAGDDVGERLKAAMLSANEAIRQHVRRPGRKRRMATTMVAAIVRSDELTIANVGDSRAYLLRGSTITQVTDDHSLVAGLLADGVISAEEAAIHPQRNVILHSLGSGPQNPRIDLFRMRVRPGDIVLLCSDGLTRYADQQQLKAMLKSEPEGLAAQRLVNFANSAGGADNITVVILYVSRAPLPRWIWWSLLVLGIGLVVVSGIIGVALMGWELWGV